MCKEDRIIDIFSNIKFLICLLKDHKLRKYNLLIKKYSFDFNVYNFINVQLLVAKYKRLKFEKKH